MASRARSVSTAAASSTRTASEDQSSLLVSLRTTAGLRATKSRLARAAAVTPLSPAAVAPVRTSPVLSTAVSSVTSPAVSIGSPAASVGSPAAAPPLPRDDAPVSPAGGEVANRLRELRVDALNDLSDDNGSDVASVSDAPESAPRPPSHTESASGLFDDDSEDESTPAGERKRLLRSVDTDDWHPYALPPVPKKHPANGRENHYDPAAPWDYSVTVPIEQLHDIRGESPHRCFLVEWIIKPLQLSWVWEEQLQDKFARRMEQLEEWRDSLRPKSFTKYFKVHYAKRAEYSRDGGCFMDAVRAACFHLGDPELATKVTDLWKPFAAKHPSTRDDVTRAKATEFFRVLQSNDCPFDYDVLFPNRLVGSFADVKTFHKFAPGLSEGVYLTSLKDGIIGHCVVFLPKGPDADVMILDGVNPPVTAEPLRNLLYLDKIMWMSLMKLNPGYRCRHGKRKTKSKRNKDRKLKEQKL